MTNKVPELIEKDGQIVFQGRNGSVLDIYIPTANFNRGKATLVDQYIQTLGVFVFEIKTQDDLVKGKSGKFNTLAFPNDISFTFSSESRYDGTLDNGKINRNSYRVFRLVAGDVFMSSTSIQQSTGSLINFVAAMHGGQIPNTLPYSDLINIYLDAMDINGNDLKSPSSTLEIIISEIARSKGDISIPYRLSKGTEYDYNLVNLSELPSLNSTFAALGFEDVDRAIIGAVNRTREGIEEKPTPLEKLAKY